MSLNPHIKIVLDLLPLAAFFGGIKWLGPFAATGLTIAATLLVMAITYAVERKIPLGLRITTAIVVVLGGVTLLMRDMRIFQMKPTFVYLAFAAVLIAGALLKKNLLKPLLGSALHLTDQGWQLLSRRWAIFFIGLAVLNEIVWRNFSFDTWVNFKTFGIITMIMLFAVLQGGIIQRHSLPQTEKKEES